MKSYELEVIDLEKEYQNDLIAIKNKRDEKLKQIHWHFIEKRAAEIEKCILQKKLKEKMI